MVLIRSGRALLSNWGRCSSGVARSQHTQQLVFSEFGEPVDVVRVEEVKLPPLKNGQVLVRMIAAPVNPADINTIQGKYPVKVSFPSIPGNEGLGTVLEVSNGVKEIRPGNRVIMRKNQQGTWRRDAVFESKFLRVVPNELGTVEAATINVNPCTAYRMLTDFKPVRDRLQDLVVIQNAANSACGQAVIQLCKAWNITNVNIVRERPDIDVLKKHLVSLGASHVLTEAEVRTTKLFKDKIVKKPVLALNCVGGKSSLEMLRHLDHSGAMVTYGGMSREPVTIPTSAFIFKDLTFYGFWMTRWNETADKCTQDQMFNEIISLMCAGSLKAPAHTMVKFDNYKEAMANALSTKGFTGTKFVLDFS